MSAQPPAAPPRPAAFVVEDDRALLAFTSLVLRQEGFDVQSAATGTDGWMRLNEIVDGDRQPVAGDEPAVTGRSLLALVVLDLALPGIDGWELLRRMRAHPTLSAIPVIVLTASAARSEAERAYALGADSYLIKPVGAYQLAAAVHKAVSGGSDGH